MKSNQGSFAKRALLAGLIAGGGILAASAYAVTADRSGDTPRCEARPLQMGDADWEGRRAARLAGLKEKLALSVEQEAAWNAFAATAQSGPRHHGMDHRAMREEFGKLSTPERLERMQAMAETRRARLSARSEATRAFYAQLTPEQQSVFDAETMPKRHRDHRHLRHQS